MLRAFLLAHACKIFVGNQSPISLLPGQKMNFADGSGVAGRRPADIIHNITPISIMLPLLYKKEGTVTTGEVFVKFISMCNICTNLES